MIIITGANGLLGRRVVENLLRRVPATDIGVSVRDPAAAGWAAERDVRVRRGDFADPASLDYAFEDATQVLVVSVDSTGDEAVRRHRAAIDAAVRSGAEHILYTSHMGANPDSAFTPMPDHAVTETILQQAGVPFTVLRNGFYAASAAQLLGNALETGKIIAPQDAPVAWTAHADLAEAAAIALTDGRPLGITPPLTGADATDLTGVAAVVAARTGRPLERIAIPDKDYRDNLLAHGLPEHLADMFTGLFTAIRNNEFAPATSDLAEILGRETTPLAAALS
ncbi:NmrA family NAD(P)-binding protein [Nocardia aurantia]|uniref:Quinone oxidoreductase 2 n=1 Tax=Nocardia aurantia TaxID=2585199 RepID=A0A7K0DMV1_9NOCA|nr:NAD(P)H-binding protein [Nocardia aurantia]MQY26672.1 Quinone oxidoreductase 2 [Nocardia aurantia]